MTAALVLPPTADQRATRCGRWLAARLALVTALVGLALGVTGGTSAHADQTVFFDDAGAAPHISLFGDSTLSGVRWYADYGQLERFNFVLSAESCRRTVEQSCISREGYRSQNVLTAMRTLDGELGEIVVVMSGYNDPAWTIDEAIEGVVDEARRQGVEHVVWLTLRTSDGVEYSDPQEQSSINTFREYNEQLMEAAEASDGFLQVADWATYSNGASGWFEGDGVHLTARGVDAVTGFIAGIVDRVLAGEDVSPAAAPWTILVPGADGEVVTAVQEALLTTGVPLPGGADGVYGDDTMIAVANYQRQNGGLQVTGAVDIATARSLGVYADPDAAPVAPVTAPAVVSAEAAPVAEARPAPPGATVADVAPAATAAPSDGSGGGVPRWVWITAAVALALTTSVVGRRRWVVLRRAQRRWARVHPATSPGRSVADLRRAGELPTPDARGVVAVLYDHERESTDRLVD